MIRILVLTLVSLCIACGEEVLRAAPQMPVPQEEPASPPPVPTFEEEPQPEGEPETEPDEPPPVDDCEGISDKVYVIDREDASLYIFDPTDGSFSFHGELDCGAFAGRPGSMSVARDGYAYVRYSDQTVYAIELETMECSETAYDASFGSFGMGYATAHASTWQDKLYVANAHQLAQLDTETWELTSLGAVPSQSELTGNAEGELWAILPLEVPAKLVHLNKDNAQVMQTISLPTFPMAMEIDTFAFATWGGDFWLFVNTYGFGQSTDVYRVPPNGPMTMFTQNTGMDVVGAGVSTCAPSE